MRGFEKSWPTGIFENYVVLLLFFVCSSILFYPLPNPNRAIYFYSRFSALNLFTLRASNLYDHETLKHYVSNIRLVELKISN